MDHEIPNKAQLRKLDDAGLMALAARALTRYRLQTSREDLRLAQALAERANIADEIDPARWEREWDARLEEFGRHHS